jgi:peptidoglycan/LPS O-acetylase OafA/YrhL
MIGEFAFLRLTGPLIAGSAWRFALSQVGGAALVVGVAAVFYRWFEQPFLSRRPAPAP